MENALSFESESSSDMKIIGAANKGAELGRIDCLVKLPLCYWFEKNNLDANHYKMWVCAKCNVPNILFEFRLCFVS